MDKNLTKEQKLYNIGFLLKCLGAVVENSPLPEVDENIDFDFIFKFAKLHKVANTAFYAIEKLNSKPDPTLYKEWKNLRNKAIHKSLVQEMEYSQLTKAFKENKIEFMALKGFEISKLYPLPEYRSMSDLDFYIKGDLLKGEQLLKSMGYENKKADGSHEKSFQKPPFLLIELHRDIVNIASPYYNYYKNFLSKLTATQGEYKMSKENFYIYNLVHLHHHFTVSGCGIRNILDLYLINKKLFPLADKEYIKTELAKLNLTAFTKEMSEIGEKWFEKKQLSDFSKTETYIFSSGAYGTLENTRKNEKAGKSRASYIFRRIFPTLKWMQSLYPTLIRHPYLLPIFYIYRPIKSILKK